MFRIIPHQHLGINIKKTFILKITGYNTLQIRQHIIRHLSPGQRIDFFFDFTGFRFFQSYKINFGKFMALSQI